MQLFTRRVVLGLTTVGLLAVGPAAAAFAADNYNPPSQIPANAQCGSGAASGAFGAFGPGFNFGNSTSGHVPYAGNATNGNGADGHATGASNAAVCGQGAVNGNP
jgi:hypothetical protein